MRSYLASIFSSQTPPPGAKEGLPYWIFWLLICVILLLVVLIFLRDKDLRQRVNEFFLGAKKRFHKLRLQVMLRRENQKITEVFQELGKEAWSENIALELGKGIRKNLDDLETKKKSKEKKLREIESNISALKRRLQELLSTYEEEKKPIEDAQNFLKTELPACQAKEKDVEAKILVQHIEFENASRKINKVNMEIHQMKDDSDIPEDEKQRKQSEAEGKINSLRKKKEAADKKITDLLSKKTPLEDERLKLEEKIRDSESELNSLESKQKEQTQKFQKEIKEWEKSKDKVLKALDEIKKKRQPLFTDLGKIFEESRVEHNNLIIYYAQLDRIKIRIQELEEKIRTFS